MAIKGWDNPLFKYVVRDSFNRADTITTTTGAVVLLIAAHIVCIEGSKMLSADEFIRSVQIAVGGFVAIWLVIMLCRACWWPFYWRLKPHGGLRNFLHARLGTFMWQAILIASGLVPGRY